MEIEVYDGKVGEYLRAISHYMGDNFTEIPVNCRRREFSDCRIILANYYRKVQCLKVSEVARLLRKDRTTIYHLYDVYDSWQRVPAMYRRQMEAYAEFVTAIHLNKII